MKRKEVDLAVPVGPDDHSQGPADAPVTLVEYGDYQCPHCGRAYPIVKRLQARLGSRLRFIFRNFPLVQAHAHAAAAAEFAEAAGLQGKFWEAHDLLYKRQRTLDAAHLRHFAHDLELDTGALEQVLRSGTPSERVKADLQGGIRSNVDGTPAFFINGHRFDGDWTDEEEFLTALR